jgi:hypothetical protein
MHNSTWNTTYNARIAGVQRPTYEPRLLDDRADYLCDVPHRLRKGCAPSVNVCLTPRAAFAALDYEADQTKLAGY